VKVRLSDDMIRFRLDRAEVSRLSQGMAIILSMNIAPTSLTMVLETSNGPAPTANSRGGLRVGLPSEWLDNWPESDVVGFDFDVRAEDSALAMTPSKVVRVVVEKDFPCSHDGSEPPKPVRMP
jgi:hypothetical protein